MNEEETTDLDYLLALQLSKAFENNDEESTNHIENCNSTGELMEIITDERGRSPAIMASALRRLETLNRDEAARLLATNYDIDDHQGCRDWDVQVGEVSLQMYRDCDVQVGEVSLQMYEAHPGNIRVRNIVFSKHQEYAVLDNKGKIKLIGDIISRISEEGRLFFKMHATTRRWEFVRKDDPEIFKEIAYLFRCVRIEPNETSERLCSMHEHGQEETSHSSFPVETIERDECQDDKRVADSDTDGSFDIIDASIDEKSSIGSEKSYEAIDTPTYIDSSELADQANEGAKLDSTVGDCICTEDGSKDFDDKSWSLAHHESEEESFEAVEASSDGFEIVYHETQSIDNSSLNSIENCESRLGQLEISDEISIDTYYESDDHENSGDATIESEYTYNDDSDTDSLENHHNFDGLTVEYIENCDSIPELERITHLSSDYYRIFREKAMKRLATIRIDTVSSNAKYAAAEPRNESSQSDELQDTDDVSTTEKYQRKKDSTESEGSAANTSCVAKGTGDLDHMLALQISQEFMNVDSGDVKRIENSNSIGHLEFIIRDPGMSILLKRCARKRLETLQRYDHINHAKKILDNDKDHTKHAKFFVDRYLDAPNVDDHASAIRHIWSCSSVEELNGILARLTESKDTPLSLAFTTKLIDSTKKRRCILIDQLASSSPADDESSTDGKVLQMVRDTCQDTVVPDNNVKIPVMVGVPQNKPNEAVGINQYQSPNCSIESQGGVGKNDIKLTRGTKFGWNQELQTHPGNVFIRQYIALKYTEYEALKDDLKPLSNLYQNLIRRIKHEKRRFFSCEGKDQAPIFVDPDDRIVFDEVVFLFLCERQRSERIHDIQLLHDTSIPPEQILQKHPGNIRMQELIGKRIHSYVMLRDDAESQTILHKNVLEIMKKENRRFFRVHETLGTVWVDADDVDVLNEIAYRFKWYGVVTKKF